MQNPLAVALLGDQTPYTGLSRAVVFCWFTDPDARVTYPPEDHDRHARFFVSGLRAALARGSGNRAEELVDRLPEQSDEFATVGRPPQPPWARGQQLGDTSI